MRRKRRNWRIRRTKKSNIYSRRRALREEDEE